MFVNQLNSNQYYIFITPKERIIPWDIYEPSPPNRGFVRYFGKVFQTVENHLKKQGLTFYVTMCEINELPSYGENVIVVILGEEWGRIPQYCHKVGAIFKCYGMQRKLECNPLLKPSYLNYMITIQFLRNLIFTVPGIVNYQFQKGKSWLLGKKNMAPIYDIPPGYYNSEDLPMKNMQERLYDVFFSGSTIHEHYPIWSLQHWIKSPKRVSREQMVSSLTSFKEKHPKFEVEFSVTSAFGQQDIKDSKSYSERMMNTKICLAPRGTTTESYRFFEAMKYGCIVVTEALPSRWFYNGSPAIEITNWRELEGILEKLLVNKQLLQEMHQQSLNWWETKCSEATVGKYIAETLNSL